MLIYMSIKTAACSNIVGLRNPEGCQKVAGGRSAELRPPVRHENIISPRRGDRASASPCYSVPQEILPHRFPEQTELIVLARRLHARILAPLRGAYDSFPSSGGPRAARGP